MKNLIYRIIVKVFIYIYEARYIFNFQIFYKFNSKLVELSIKEKNQDKKLNLFNIDNKYFNKEKILKSQNFIVRKNNIWSKYFYKIKNRSYFFKKLNDEIFLEQSMIHIPEECYLLTIEHGNIGHFFHDQFFPLYKLWRKIPKKVLAIVSVSKLAATKIGSNDEVIYDFLISIFGIDNVIRASADNTYSLPSLIVPPEGRSLYPTYNYGKLCLEIKNKCIANLNLTPASSRSKIILYPREGLERKNLLGVDSSFINRHCINIVQFHNLSFREQVNILIDAKILIYIVGASVFNILFVNSDCKVLEINPYKNNSWAQKFGLAKLCNFSVYISDNIEKNNDTIQGDWRLDAHIWLDDKLKNYINKFINSSK